MAYKTAQILGNVANVAVLLGVWVVKGNLSTTLSTGLGDYFFKQFYAKYILT